MEQEGGQEEEETGDQESHKNVQKAWPYFRAVETLFAKERRGKEKKDRNRKQLPITLRQNDVKV